MYTQLWYHSIEHFMPRQTLPHIYLYIHIYIYIVGGKRQINYKFIAIVHSHQFIQFESSGMAWMIPQLWNHSGQFYTSFLGQKTQNTLGRCTRNLRSKNSFFTCVPFLILGRKVFNCQHGIARTAGEKRVRRCRRSTVHNIFFLFATFVLLLSPMAC